MGEAGGGWESGGHDRMQSGRILIKFLPPRLNILILHIFAPPPSPSFSLLHPLHPYSPRPLVSPPLSVSLPSFSFHLSFLVLSLFASQTLRAQSGDREIRREGEHCVGKPMG